MNINELMQSTAMNAFNMCYLPKIGDILLTRPNGTEIKISDLSLARTIRTGKLQALDYGKCTGRTGKLQVLDYGKCTGRTCKLLALGYGKCTGRTGKLLALDYGKCAGRTGKLLALDYGKCTGRTGKLLALDYGKCTGRIYYSEFSLSNFPIGPHTS